MTEAIAFDTHRFIKRLTDCGFTEQQAETLADEHVGLLKANLATKDDIAQLRTGTKDDIESVKADIAQLRADTKSDIASTNERIARLEADTKTRLETMKKDLLAQMAAMKVDILKWMISGMAAQGGIFAALIKLL